MKITAGNLDPSAIPHGMKHVQFRATRWGIIAQKKPSGPQTKRTTLQKQYSTRFGFAGRMASNLQPLEAITAIELSKGTQQVPRDVATQACLGRLYVFQQEDGTLLRTLERPTINDPFCYRPPSLCLSRPTVPWETLYLTIDGTNRLKIS